MSCTSVTRRTQFSSCDECRRSRVACDASASGSASEHSGPGPCTRCRNRERSCTFKWLDDAKRDAPRRGSRKGRRTRAYRSPSVAPSLQESSGTDITVDPHPTEPTPGAGSNAQEDTITVSFETSEPPAFTPLSTSSIATHHHTGGQSEADYEWLLTLYKWGFEAVFGSWMGRYSCPFLFGQDRLADKYVSVSDLCRRLDRKMVESAVNNECDHREDEQDQKLENSLRGSIAAFSARWLPLLSPAVSSDVDHLAVVQALWRLARRDMLRIIHRPSYRSMLSLLLFSLTPIPSGISEDEETDGISGQVCVHAALQQIQILRARQKNLKFSGSKVSPFLKETHMLCASPDATDASGFINDESTAYWAALTFDTSASLTLDSRPLLSSGLFGFECEMPWQLVRTCSNMFRETAERWRRENAEMTDERANQIIAAGAAWKLLGWKLTAVFKEAARDGHQEPEVQRAFAAVLESVRKFNDVYRPQLEECHKRLQFLGQQTKLRWFSLMLHYHLSILLLIDVIEVTDRHDLLADITDVISDAEATVMNTLAYGLHTTIILKPDPPDLDSDLGGTRGGDRTFTVPIVSIDPHPHHVVAGVQLMRKAIDRDFGSGKITDVTHQSLLSTLELTLTHLPQSSKSVQAARAEFPPPC